MNVIEVFQLFYISSLI